MPNPPTVPEDIPEPFQPDRFLKITRQVLTLFSVAMMLSIAARRGFYVPEQTDRFFLVLDILFVLAFLVDLVVTLIASREPKTYIRRHKFEALIPLVLLGILVASVLLHLFSWIHAPWRTMVLAVAMTLRLYLVIIVFLQGLRANQEMTILRLSPTQTLVLSFVFAIGLGALILWMPRMSTGEGSIAFIDALFTSASAVCVTGLIVLDTPADFTLEGQTAILFLIQVGAIGIMTATSISATLMGRGLGLRERAALRDVLDTRTLGSITEILRAVFLVTFCTEFIGAVFLYLFWDPSVPVTERLYHSVFHSISAFCNAGFSTLSTSLMNYRTNAGIVLTASVLITVGGFGFLVVRDVVRCLAGPPERFWRRIATQTRLVLVYSTILTLSGTILIFLMEAPRYGVGHNLGEAFLNSLFQSVTARTAGFNTIPIRALSNSTLLLIIYLMFIGASPGSTGGGIKTSTLGILVGTVRSMITGRLDVEVWKRRIPRDAVRAALCVFFLSTIWIQACSLLLCYTERDRVGTYLPVEERMVDSRPIRPIDYVFEEVSAFGTVGLSTGVTPHLSIAGKFIIILSMFFGRLGPVTIMLAIAQRQKPRQFRYPEDRVMVG